MSRKPRLPGLAAGGIARTLSERGREASQASQQAAGTPADIASRLGAAFDGFAALLENLGADKTGQVSQSIDLPLGPDGKTGRAVFGYTIRTGLGGVRAERFGHSPEGAAQAKTPTPRAPITDVFEEAGTLRVVAELPGVLPDNVRCAVRGQTLAIETVTEPHYAKTLDLPLPVVPDSLSRTVANGILEIRLSVAGAPGEKQ